MNEAASSRTIQYVKKGFHLAELSSETKIYLQGVYKNQCATNM